MTYYLVLQLHVAYGVALVVIPTAYTSWEAADAAGKDAIRLRSDHVAGDMGYTVVPAPKV